MIVASHALQGPSNQPSVVNHSKQVEVNDLGHCTRAALQLQFQSILTHPLISCIPIIHRPVSLADCVPFRPQILLLHPAPPLPRGPLDKEMKPPHHLFISGLSALVAGRLNLYREDQCSNNVHRHHAEDPPVPCSPSAPRRPTTIKHHE